MVVANKPKNEKIDGLMIDIEALQYQNLPARTLCYTYIRIEKTLAIDLKH